jgi:hypothetical protein
VLYDESPAAGLTADGAGMSISADALPYTFTQPWPQRIPALLALHLGNDWLRGWTAGRGL